MEFYYIVKLQGKDNILCGETTISFSTFCGKMIKKTDSHFYFELNGSGALVIIPHDWIDWMAPSKKHWPFGESKK